jgi:PKD repeat protein
LIPRDVSQLLGISRLDIEEEIQRYQFLRLLSSAKTVHLAYRENKESERSRFIEQLIWNKQKTEQKLDAVEITQAGSYRVTFAVTDPMGASASEAITITVTDTVANLPPVAASQAVTTPEDTPVALTLSASDPEGALLTYTVAGSPSHGTLSGPAPTLTYTPALNYAGPDSFTFTATDSLGAVSNTATISLTISPVNDAPILTTIGAQTIRAERLLTFTLDAQDVDSSPLTYSAAGLPAGASCIGQTFSWTPTSMQTGTYTVTFTVSDGALSDREDVTITVTSAKGGGRGRPKSR